MTSENTAISIVSANLILNDPISCPLLDWLNNAATAPPCVIEAKVQINRVGLEDAVVCLVVEEAIKLRLPQLCSQHPELIDQEWRVNNLTILSGKRSLFLTTPGVYRTKDVMAPTHREDDIATFLLIPKAYDELSHFQRSLWKLGLKSLSIQGVPLYRTWVGADGDILYLHLKSSDPLPPISDNDIYDWLQLGTPVDLMKIGDPAVRSYPTHRGSVGVINNLEIAVPLNGAELLVGNVITAEDSPTSMTAPVPSCKNCLHFGGATPSTLEDPGDEDCCRHPEREGFPSVDSDAEETAIKAGEDAVWELYADGCPGYQWQDPNQPQEPDDLPMLTSEDLAVANQLEANLLPYGPGMGFTYPLLPQKLDWMIVEGLLAHEKLGQASQQSNCKFLATVETTYLNQHSVRKVELVRQITVANSPIPQLTTIVVSTPESDRAFQFNGAHIDELMPAEGKVQRLSVRSTQGDLWYDQAHLEVMQALHALENAIRRMMGVPEESWDEEPIIDEFGIPVVGIDSDAGDVQPVFE